MQSRDLIRPSDNWTRLSLLENVYLTRRSQVHLLAHASSMQSSFKQPPQAGQKWVTWLSKSWSAKYEKSPTMIFGFLIVGFIYVYLSYLGIGNFKFGFGFIIMF